MTTTLGPLEETSSSSGNRVKIRLDSLCVSYPLAKGELQVIRDFTLEVWEGEFLCVVGTSGCGKSTLLATIAGLLPATSGQVVLDGTPVRGTDPDRAMVFQEDAVFPWYTVRQNIEYGLRIANMPRSQRERIVDNYLRLVGLAGFQHSFPRELSGGMRKRVDVARAMAIGPEVLLMDEPFAALDVITKERLQHEFLQLWNTARMTVVFVTHDLEEALFLSDRIVVMSTRPGRVQRIVSVPFARPRQAELRTSSEFQRLRRELSLELKE